MKYRHRPWKPPDRIFPANVATVPELLRVLNRGFELASLNRQSTGSPYWALKKGSRYSAPGLVSESAAQTVVANYCEKEFEELKSGTLIFKLKPYPPKDTTATNSPGG